MLNPFLPENFWMTPSLEQNWRPEEEKGEFQTRILFDYLEQITRGRGEKLEVYQVGEFKVGELVAELKKRLLDGRLRVNWSDVVEPVIGVVEGEERYVQAELPQRSFDLIALFSDEYYRLRRPILDKGMDWLTGRLGALLGLEVDGYAVVMKLHPYQMQRAQKEAWDAVVGMVRESVKLGE